MQPASESGVSKRGGLRAITERLDGHSITLLVTVIGLITLTAIDGAASDYSALLFGVIGSVFGSLALGVVGLRIYGTMQSEIDALRSAIDDPVSELNSEIGRLQAEIGDLNKLGVRLRQDVGVYKIKKKYEDDPNFWLELLRTSSNRLDLAGNKLAAWTRVTYKETFCDTLSTLARSGTNVRILVADIDISSHIKESETEDVWALHALLRETALGLDEEYKDNIELRTTSGREKLKYMLVANDVYTVFGGYLCKSASRDSIVMTLYNESPYVEGLLADFDRTFKSGSLVHLGEVGEACAQTDQDS